MKRFDGLFEKIADPDNLSAAFDRAARGKRYRASVRKACARKDTLLRKLREDLLTGAYQVSRYDTRVIYEPKQREIHILPFFPDRVVQHAIMRVLEPIWDSHMAPQSFSCRVGKGQHKASALARSHVRRYKYVLQCDISKFYPSLGHAVLKQVIRRKLKDQRLLALLDRIIDSDYGECGVPIGSLMSQWFGNLYLTGLDRLVIRNHLAAGYVRYCDDFVLFGNDKAELRRALFLITGWLDTMRLRLSRYKLFPATQGLDFLGYRHFSAGYVLLRKRTARRLARRVKSLWAHLGHLRNIQNTVGQLASAKGWLKHANCYNFRVKLQFDLLYDMVMERYRGARKHERLSQQPEYQRGLPLRSGEFSAGAVAPGFPTSA